MKKLLLSIIILILSYCPVYADRYDTRSGDNKKIKKMIKGSKIIASTTKHRDLYENLSFWAEKNGELFVCNARVVALEVECVDQTPLPK